MKNAAKYLNYLKRERDQREGDWRTYVVGECEQFVWINHRELIRIPVTTTDTRTCRAQLELIIHRLYIARGGSGEKLSQSVAWRLSNTNNAASWQLLPFIKHVRRDSCSRKAGERMQGAGSRVLLGHLCHFVLHSSSSSGVRNENNAQNFACFA